VENRIGFRRSFEPGKRVQIDFDKMKKKAVPAVPLFHALTINYLQFFTVPGLFQSVPAYIKLFRGCSGLVPTLFHYFFN
jgi:hypothetical protein